MKIRDLIWFDLRSMFTGQRAILCTSASVNDIVPNVLNHV
jgi:hypothetical protein